MFLIWSVKKESKDVRNIQWRKNEGLSGPKSLGPYHGNRILHKFRTDGSWTTSMGKGPGSLWYDRLNPSQDHDDGEQNQLSQSGDPHEIWVILEWLDLTYVRSGEAVKWW